jgi:pimeloyl-ACP methyl ester carboxylesterase
MYTRARCHALVAVAFFLLVSPAFGADPPAKEMALGDCLVLAPVGRYSRGPLHIDALEAEIVAGRWKAPRAREVVRWVGGERTWEAAHASKEGAIDHDALRGGYLYWKVAAERPEVMLLEASGHLAVYVNGEPRAGDPYQNGIVRLPVQLRSGDNDLLFHCGRGHLNARLVPPTRAVFLDTRDVTLPDLLSDLPPEPAALLVVNASTKPIDGLMFAASCDGETIHRSVVPTLAPLSVRKAMFSVSRPPGTGENVTCTITLESKADGKPRKLDTAKVTLRRRGRDQSHRRTFTSSIDGSVQYFAVQPANPAKDSQPGLILSLHGAAVEAMGQADCYSRKPWAHVVAPTNRRAFGFDWEDWGRLDAMQVLEVAAQQLGTDPQRTWVTGHSMGGHGTWHLGVTFPDRFAAIAPSAGWISFWSYAGGVRPTAPTPVEQMLLRAASPSDTLSLLRNTAPGGVYVLHGDGDDNVPVEQARTMRQRLGEFHPNFVYYERPGAGHWWGNECMDWPPLLEFLSRHTLPRRRDVRKIDFSTASPGVSSQCHWATIEQQVHPLQLSTIHLRFDPDKRRVSGTTENVARLTLELAALKRGDPVTVELDGQTLTVPVPMGTGPAREVLVHLFRDRNRWASAESSSPPGKGPRCYGPFKEVFRNRVMFVYGTRGTAEENAWALAKARFDAETFWYRGNGAVDVVPDTAFDPDSERDRNVVLYGHAESNGAWKALLGTSPVQVRRGMIRIGDREEKGDGLACLVIRPRPSSTRALVGVVGGSGVAGMRLTDRLAYFVSGIGYPDCLVLGPETLTSGSEGVRTAGFFGNDWSVESGEWAGKTTP